MKNSILLKAIKVLLSPLVLCIAACSFTSEGFMQQLLGRSVQSPVFIECKPVSSTELLFRFSSDVEVVSLHFDAEVETESITSGSEVLVTLAKPLGEGRKITADILVEDSKRNSLNVIVPFRARNERMPALIFNELRTEYSKPKAEFVEFYALEAGNLGAMRLYIAGHSLKPVYEFAPMEVKAGEYIVLHLRTVEEGCVDETGTNLALSGGTDAQNDARDLWVPGTTKLIHKTDALWLVDQDDRVIDAVVLSETADSTWASKHSAIASAAEYLAREKAWRPLSGDADPWIPNPASAIITDKTTNTRTVCRDETVPLAKNAGNWYITATSSATPGKPNNPKRYQ